MFFDRLNSLGAPHRGCSACQKSPVRTFFDKLHPPSILILSKCCFAPKVVDVSRLLDGGLLYLRRALPPQAPPLLYYLCPAAHFFDRLKTASVHRTEAVPVTISRFQISARINTPRPNRSYAWRACRSRRRPRRASPARRGCSARTSPPSPSCPARTAGRRTTWS